MYDDQTMEEFDRLETFSKRVMARFHLVCILSVLTMHVLKHFEIGVFRSLPPEILGGLLGGYVALLFFLWGFLYVGWVVLICVRAALRATVGPDCIRIDVKKPQPGPRAAASPFDVEDNWRFTRWAGARSSGSLLEDGR